MARSVHISEDLHASALSANQAHGRSRGQQLEHWGRLGAALDAGLNTENATCLLGKGAQADAFVARLQGSTSTESAELPLLRERHRRDALEVAAGLRSARSLWAFQEGDLDGYSFSFNPESEFARPGEGW
ncbi:TA system antitoxin ParD family protein [Hydrogenophaga atypica]|uniref:ParD-like antitoxin of type II toxin-antitoxin system n=1 Tax=Hydrogenophaga atypica TaxID=249409 RepID=A0ABW2QQV1_9BURK